MSKPTIEELAALACNNISYQVHLEESETANYSEIGTASLEAETALINLIRAVVEEMRPEQKYVSPETKAANQGHDALQQQINELNQRTMGLMKFGAHNK